MRFLLCSLDSLGFLYPMMGIARALERRGHETAFVADETLDGLLAEHGLRRIPRGAKDGTSFRVREWVGSFPIAIQVKHVEHALASFPADALVGQSLTLGPLLAAERRRLPVAVMGFCTYLWPTGDPYPGGDREIEERLAWRHGETIRWWNKARDLFHLPHYKGTCEETPLLGDLFLVRSVPELEPRADSLPERAHLVGSCLWEPEEVEPELEGWLAETARSGLPLVYVQHGRTFHVPGFWAQLVEALGDKGCRVAASAERMDQEPGALPANFFVRPSVPQRRVLRQAAAVVASANTTAFLGALEAGAPSLLIPAGGEQPDVATLGRRLGCARVLKPEQVTPEVLRAELDRLLAGGCRDQARRCSAALTRVDSFERVADLLEALAERRQPILHPAAVARALSAVGV